MLTSDRNRDDGGAQQNFMVRQVTGADYTGTSSTSFSHHFVENQQPKLNGHGRMEFNPLVYSNIPGMLGPGDEGSGQATADYVTDSQHSMMWMPQYAINPNGIQAVGPQVSPASMVNAVASPFSMMVMNTATSPSSPQPYVMLDGENREYKHYVFHSQDAQHTSQAEEEYEESELSGSTGTGSPDGSAYMVPYHSASTKVASSGKGSSQGEKRQQCKICGKFFRRDLPRHLRTHQEVARFVCPFPRADCPHKRGQFNRPYDFKKHLLHGHFVFDDQKTVRSFRDLMSKLSYRGTCHCGMRFVARDWLEDHVLNAKSPCPCLANRHAHNSTKWSSDN